MEKVPHKASRTLRGLTDRAGKRVFATFCLLAAVSMSPLAAGDPSSFRFSLAAGPGLGFGIFHELVLPPEGHESSLLSRLDWEMQPLPSLDILARLEYGNRWRILLSGTFYLPAECGIMEDYDWLYSNLDDWTHYSRSRNNLVSGLNTEITASLTLLEKKSFFLEGGILLGIQYISFSDNLDYQLYTSGLDSVREYNTGDPFRDDEQDRDGMNAIDYRIFTFTSGLGVGAGFRWTRFLIRGECFFSPLMYYSGEDRHLARNRQFQDTVFPWFALMGRVTGSLRLTENFFLELSGQVRWYCEGTGDSVISDLDGDNPALYQDSIGFSALVGHFSLVAGIEF